MVGQGAVRYVPLSILLPGSAEDRGQDRAGAPLVGLFGIPEGAAVVAQARVA